MTIRHLVRLGIASSLLSIAYGFSAHAAIVTPADTSPTAVDPFVWGDANVRPGGSVAITNSQPRSGNGSLEFATSGSGAKADFEIFWNDPTRTLGNLSAASFDWYRDSSSTAPQHLTPTFRLYFQTASGETGLLIWEDVYNGGSTAVPAPTDTWVSEDITDDNFWMRAFGPGRTIEQFGVTLADWEGGATFPNPSGQSPVLGADTLITGMNVGVGSGWAGDFLGYVDNVSLTFGQDDTILANFETAAVPEPASLALFVVGLLGLGATARRRRA
ncbi:PEP-CTERM sorting domain-containing protein [Oceanibacterium hippocampi]|uniref:PEP-CTERM motif protein n=1 Tax=Oceanibacterium hippocampi TaxID=745714 RepID=A0A1Y5S9W6_9PROT|nr:PEP-CTERM sorting domain-containing protein [Oceanibacterium hippocampi]SLN35524.1 PEP-CTERM motif protein [Oceanibacterium hippocampi]